MAQLIGRSVQEVARKVAQMPTFRANARVGQPAPGKTRHAIDVTVRAKSLGEEGGIEGWANEQEDCCI